MGSAAVQGDLWGTRPRDWAELQEPLQTPYYEAVFDALEISSGTRLLDAGCGSGLAPVLAAKRGATVTGIDAAEPLVEIARERLPDADLRVGEIENLPYTDGSFDAVTSFNAVQYAAIPAAALAELRRVTARGGRVAVVTWGPPEHCQMRDVLAAVGSLLPPPPPGAGGPFALSAPGALDELLRTAGLTAVGGDDVATPFEYADVESAWRALAASGPGARAVRTVGESAARETIGAVFARYQRPDGRVRLANEFRYVIGTP